ncbi:MAG TPA: YciI family protein [Gaiellaceae bacterium]|nr:YciI family protein [Gaiellaceae bacterium]
MKYALLIYDDDSAWVDLPDEEKAALRSEEMPKWVALFEELGKADPDVSGHELDGRNTAKVVSVRDGERIVTDGPFAETKEALGGVFVIDLPDLDEAIRLAALIPAADVTGAIEIRPTLQ